MNDTTEPARWWITTGPLQAPGSKKILGPFESQELALKVRGYVEKVERHERYWVDSEPVDVPAAPAGPGTTGGDPT